MSPKYKFNDQNQLYFITFAVVNWIELFIRNEYKDIMIDSKKHYSHFIDKNTPLVEKIKNAINETLKNYEGAH
jgi:hypothetical protein